MNSQIFDSARFGTYFRCYTATNGRRLALYAAITLLIWLMVCILPYALTFFSDYLYATPVDPAWRGEANWGFLLLLVLGACSATQLYSSLHRPGARVGVLTLPASGLEKFLTWFIIYFLGFIVVFYVSAFLADLARVGLVRAFAAAPEAARPITPRVLFAFGSDVPLSEYKASDAIQLVLFYGMALLTFASFTLGSSIFSKNAFIKTACSIAILNTVLGYVAFLSFKVFFKGGFVASNFETTGATVWAIGATLAVLSAFFIWLSYLRFKEIDNVDRW